MTLVVPEAGRWLVSTQTHGEVTTVQAAAPGLSLLLLGLPSGFNVPEVQNWLEGLARAVTEGAEAPTPEDVAPPVLRQALEGLLFTHEEIWGQAGPLTPCSVVLVHRDGRLGLGWVGDAAVEIQLDGIPLNPDWLWIRDPSGREARAWCTTPEHDVWVELACVTDQTAPATVRIEAHWVLGAEHEEPEFDPVLLEEGGPEEDLPEEELPETDLLETETGPESMAEDRPSSGVARWLAQHVEWQEESTYPSPVPRPQSVEEAAAGSLAFPDQSVPGDQASMAEPEPTVMPAEPEFSDPFAAHESADLSVETEPSDPLAEHEPAVLPSAAPSLSPAAYEPSPSPELAPEPRARSPRRPSWPVPPPPTRPGRWKRPLLWGGVALGLVGLGWAFGAFQSPDGPQAQRPSGAMSLLRSIGLAGARFEAQVQSAPPGAWIAVDGKELAARTPTTLDLRPGEHRVDLSFPGLGSASYTVKGRKNERVTLSAPLWGALEVVASQAGAVVAVALDGESKGFAPVTIERLAPGPHELRFTGPGMAAWGTTVEVRIGEKREVLAYPLQSPATGVLQVRATLNVAGEAQPLAGARVWIDGEPRGVTPLTLELDRGPHSVRTAYRQEEAAIQVIDLPGGNQRFATFEFGLDVDLPRIQLKAPAQISLEEPVVISATLSQATASEVREMWLHVRTPENRWRRYPMTLLDAQGSVVGAASFPAALLGPARKTTYYVSALTAQGDEHFTELQRVQAAPGPR